jgi:hypothetical protein
MGRGEISCDKEKREKKSTCLHQTGSEGGSHAKARKREGVWAAAFNSKLFFYRDHGLLKFNRRDTGRKFYAS